jgi:hypothetical protein
MKSANYETHEEYGLWTVTPCSSEKALQGGTVAIQETSRSRRQDCSCLDYCSTMKMEAITSYEMPGLLRNVRNYNLEDSALHSLRCGNRSTNV